VIFVGVQITELLKKKDAELTSFNGSRLAVDSSLFIYQFLTTIRQRDGTPLKDSQGRITSHLAGVFSRTTRLMQCGLKLAYVFDGKPPALKRAEQERRSELKDKASLNYQAAAEQEDTRAMRKYASQTSRLTPEMVEEVKALVSALGLPVIQAPSEAEAQAALMAKLGDVRAVASQDADVLMFGSPCLVRNLSLVGKRKTSNRFSYETVKPEEIQLSETLNSLGIDLDQFTALCMLVGTDYNLGGVKGIGPKGALKLVKKHKKDFDSLFAEAGWKNCFSLDWKTVFDTIKKIPTTRDYSLDWSAIDECKVKELLIETHDFSAERINTTISRLQKEKEKTEQTGLGTFLQ